METKSATPWFSDKSFILTILTPILFFAGKKLGISFNGEEIAGLISVVVTFIVGNKWKSGAVLAAEIKANATSNAAALPPAPSPAAALAEAGK